MTTSELNPPSTVTVQAVETATVPTFYIRASNGTAGTLNKYFKPVVFGGSTSQNRAMTLTATRADAALFALDGGDGGVLTYVDRLQPPAQPQQLFSIVQLSSPGGAPVVGNTLVFASKAVVDACVAANTCLRARFAVSRDTNTLAASSPGGPGNLDPSANVMRACLDSSIYVVSMSRYDTPSSQLRIGCVIMNLVAEWVS